jgi:membrane protein DedA with SNARE-associated domain
MFEQIFNLNGIGDLSPGIIFFAFFFATFISEDAACLAAGALVGRGEIAFLLAVGACFTGIFTGDVLLYWAGRFAGTKILNTKIASRFVSANALATASAWLEKRGAAAIFISRFITGLRLPTYLAAGFLRTPFWKFALYFLLASAIWTPILIASTAYAQQFNFLPNIFLSAAFLYIALKILLHFTSWKNRRFFVGRLTRIRHWEFWSLPVFYFPVVIYILLLAVRFRSLSVFADANPAIEAGGFVGESKSEIYEGLRKSEAAAPHLLVYALIPARIELAERLEIAESFLRENRFNFPVALKPNAGERGVDVFLVRTSEELKSRIGQAKADLIIQELAPGDEFSVFYYRYPNEPRGQIFAITEKRFPAVVGDGKSSIETLILRDERAVALAKAYFERNAKRLGEIPRAGETIPLIDIGTHSKGAIFLDGDWARTAPLENEIDRICLGFKGFYFGRFDLRAASAEEFRRGVFKIIELNGVTSEATNIYDPRNSLLDAYRILFRQWRIAFEIGVQNRASGAPVTTLKDLVKLLTERWFGKLPKKLPLRSLKAETVEYSENFNN